MSYKEELLGDYIDILSGFAFKTKDFVDNGVPIIKIKNIPGSRCLLTIARKLMADDKDSVFEEFIFKSYPMNRQEDVVKDVSVILLILEEEKDLLPALFNEFRMEVEARHCRGES